MESLLWGIFRIHLENREGQASLSYRRLMSASVELMEGSIELVEGYQGSFYQGRSTSKYFFAAVYTAGHIAGYIATTLSGPLLSDYVSC